MANFVKAKASVTVFAVAAIVLIPLLESNFNAPPSFTRWSQTLTWDSFKAVPRIFSKYDAGISSNMYLAYDSVTQQYYSYAAQNNNYSWAKPGVKDSAHHYLLNHEQYHFNISEIHARMMNQFIKANPGLNEGDYTSRLYELKRSLRVMQDYYDHETNHSVNRSIQRRWEFKIDSMLQVHAGDSGIITDYYSGAQVFLPIKPDDIKTGVNSHGVSYRYFGILKYDMTLLCFSYQLDETDTDDLTVIEEGARNTYDYIQYLVRSFEVLPRGDTNQVIRFIAEDTVHQKRLIDHWTGSRNYLYRISAEFPLSSDTSGYYQIANSFLNSVNIVDTDAYWISKLSQDTTLVTATPMVTVETSKSYRSNTCYTIPPGSVHGFYRGPIPYQNRWLIAYDITDQPDTLISEHAMYANGKLITFHAYDEDILYATGPTDHLKLPATVAVGYVMKNDTTSGCRILHNHKIMVEPLEPQRPD